MSLVLVVEPDTAQANVLRQVLLKRVGAELVLVDSTAAAVDAIDQHIPDLILLSALLSPRDEDMLMGHLRTLEGASHLQTLTIPQLGTEGKSRARKSSSFGFGKKRQSDAPSGCDPAVFAEEIVAHLARAAEIKSRPKLAIPFRSLTREAQPPAPTAAELAAQAETDALFASAPPIIYPSSQETTPEPPPSTGYEASSPIEAPPSNYEPPPASYAPSSTMSYDSTPTAYQSPSDSVFNPLPPIEPEPPASVIQPEPIAEPETTAQPKKGRKKARVEPVSIVDDDIEKLARELGLDVTTLEFDALESSTKSSSAKRKAEPEPSFDFQAELARVEAEAKAKAEAVARVEAEAKITAEIERVRAEAETRRLEELARVEAEAAATRKRAIAEARAAAEREARETLAAEMARVRSEAEATFADALNKVKVEAEQTLGKEIGRAREDVEELVRLRTEAEKAFAADLARVRKEVEQSLSAQMKTARAEAERARAAEAEVARVRAEAEERLKAEQAEKVRLADVQVARVRAEAEAQLKAEVERVRAEAERTKEEADRIKEEADRARWVEKTKAKQAAQQIKEEAAVQARALAEAEARRAIEAEVARVKAEADHVLEAELARARAEAEARQAAELEALRAQMAEMRQSAAQQARAAAAEAVLSEVAQVATQSKLNIVRKEPNVIQFKPATAQAQIAEPAIEHSYRNEQEPYQHEATYDRASYRAPRYKAPAHHESRNTDDDDGASATPTNNDVEEVAPAARVQPEAQPTRRRDYYSLWHPRTGSDHEAAEDVEPRFKWNLRRHAKWALPSAACVLLIISTGAISSVARFVSSGEEKVPARVVVEQIPKAAPVAAPAVAKNVGELRVESTPEGAEILIDGKSYGETPKTVSGLKPGTHTLTLRSDAGTIIRQITVRGGESGMVSEAIFNGWIAIFSPIPLNILVDGRPVTLTDDGRIMTTPGKHQVEMISEQFKYRTTETLEVRPGDVTPHTFSLPMGSVHLTAPDGTEIRVEGEVVGRMPLEDLSIAIGNREITAVHPLLGERKVTVEVRHGEVADVKFYSE
jgi:CheY-like chemotaxis protein